MNPQIVYDTANPFSPGDDAAYRRWRDARLAAHPRDPEALWTEIGDLTRLTRTEKDHLLAAIRCTNMAFYRTARQDQVADKEAVFRFGQQLGLVRLDHNLCVDEEGLSSITVCDKARGNDYIPYTNKGINWHTDGYYNDPDHLIRGMILHCVRPAARGGANRLLDPELLYIQLRDRNPAWVQALMHPRAMTIPANLENAVEVRPARTGPVFSVDAGGALHTRYTHRTRSIQWREDAATAEAVSALRQMLDDGIDGMISHRFQPGEGVICNNVLHERSPFEDHGDSGRLLYRARYYDRIADN